MAQVSFGMEFEVDRKTQVSLGTEFEVDRKAQVSLGTKFEVDRKARVSPEVRLKSVCFASSVREPNNSARMAGVRVYR